MNEENTKKVIEIAPTLYRAFYDKSSITPFGSYTFQHSDGWFNIVYNLSSKLEKLIQQDGQEASAKLKVVQIKEKFGCLTIYTSGYRTDEMRQLIDSAADLSLKTCELCGKPGKERDTDWIQVLCKKCYKKIQNDNMIRNILR